MIHRITLIAVMLLAFTLQSTYAEEHWFRLYQQGEAAMKNGNYQKAISLFERCMAVKNTDKKKIRTYGMHFISYYPNREIGIAHYFLGNIPEARKYLQISLAQAPSQRAQEFLNKTAGGVSPPPQPAITEKIPDARPKTATTPNPEKAKPKEEIELIGERMSVAVFPFENKGASRDLGNIVLDKMITALFNKKRFKVIERSQLEKVLEEQKLGASGLIDASTAAELGRNLGVDAIILGSVAATNTGSISLDARAIDTETAAIIVAHDAYSDHADPQSVKRTVDFLADQFVTSLPLISGSIIRLDGASILLDVGRNGGLKKGIKCVVYRKGKEIRHPTTGEVLGREKTIIGYIQITDTFDKYSTARVVNTKAGLQIQVGDSFLTK